MYSRESTSETLALEGAIGTHFDITGLPLIANALESEGFNRLEIELIMGGNVRDFMLKNLP